jgi:hypothetical protein
MNIQVLLTFQAGLVNNSPMEMTISVNDKSINQPVTEQFQVALDVDLPAVVEFKLSGKSSADTLVVDDQIVADKFIKLESIELDGFPVKPWQIPDQYLYLDDGTNQHHTNYWGFNGTAKLIIDQTDPAFWLLECPKITSNH